MTDNNQKEPLNSPTAAEGGSSPDVAVVTEEVKSASPSATASSGGKGLAGLPYYSLWPQPVLVAICGINGIRTSSLKKRG
ncbi:MAG: hypothetical protein HC808_19460 [Candidatus Competibacteraceae bacterium]|nr:hypothetical protein [Candidatus Competibacteraceae bacterium]